MFDKLKDIFPGVLLSLIISLTTTLVVFAGTFSSLRAEVQFHSDALKTKVNKDEFDALLKGLNQMDSNFDRRFDRIEQKLDRINERVN